MDPNDNSERIAGLLSMEGEDAGILNALQQQETLPMSFGDDSSLFGGDDRSTEATTGRIIAAWTSSSS